MALGVGLVLARPVAARFGPAPTGTPQVAITLVEVESGLVLPVLYLFFTAAAVKVTLRWLALLGWLGRDPATLNQPAALSRAVLANVGYRSDGKGGQRLAVTWILPAPGGAEEVDPGVLAAARAAIDLVAGGRPPAPAAPPPAPAPARPAAAPHPPAVAAPPARRAASAPGAPPARPAASPPARRAAPPPAAARPPRHSGHCRCGECLKLRAPAPAAPVRQPPGAPPARPVAPPPAAAPPARIAAPAPPARPVAPPAPPARTPKQAPAGALNKWLKAISAATSPADVRALVGKVPAELMSPVWLRLVALEVAAAGSLEVLGVVAGQFDPAWPEEVREAAYGMVEDRRLALEALAV